MPSQTPPGVLYHYTTQEALLKILEGEKWGGERKHVLWATKIRYMNDASELIVPLEMAGEILDTILLNSQERLEETQADIARAMRWAVKQVPDVNISVVSFSAHEDDLSQWRAYSQGSLGCAIGFDSAELMRSACTTDRSKLVPCEYPDEGNQRNRIKGLISTCISSGDYGDFIFRLLMMASTMKNKSFEREGEWRIVLSDIGHPPDHLMTCTYLQCRFRPGKSMLIPYWPLPFDLSAIREIWIGPTPHRELEREALRGLLYSHDVGEQVKVENSSIPYRNW